MSEERLGLPAAAACSSHTNTCRIETRAQLKIVTTNRSTSLSFFQDPGSMLDIASFRQERENDREAGKLSGKGGGGGRGGEGVCKRKGMKERARESGDM